MRAGRLADVPGAIVQGRYDVVTPLRTAWELHRRWPRAKWVVVADAGHAATERGSLRRLSRLPMSI